MQKYLMNDIVCLLQDGLDSNAYARVMLLFVSTGIMITSYPFSLNVLEFQELVKCVQKHDILFTNTVLGSKELVT